eukprot:Hpha_TRINITY_DN15433_c0_g5::TRINITY_DN15433_c0_g5_i2::g.175953::m.175953
MRAGSPDIEELKRKYNFKKSNNIDGLGHIVLVCKDVEATLDFYCDKLGFPLEKVVDCGGLAYHIFLNMGGGQHLAFFHFIVAPKQAPGIANSKGLHDLVTAHGSMNHLAIKVNSLKEAEEWHKDLKAKGVAVSPFLHHEWDKPNPKVRPGKTEFSSFYMKDPDGVLLEVCYTHLDFKQPATYGSHFPVDPRVLKSVRRPKL